MWSLGFRPFFLLAALTAVVWIPLWAVIYSGAEPAWFLLVPSAMFVMTGIQLLTSWLLGYLLTELSKRELNAEADLDYSAGVEEEDETMILPVGDKALV